METTICSKQCPDQRLISGEFYTAKCTSSYWRFAQQQLRKPSSQPSVQQDQDELKHLALNLLDSNSYKQRLISLFLFFSSLKFNRIINPLCQHFSSNPTIKNFYKEKITDQEHAQINERITLQQRQFANHESREKIRKHNAIREVFDYLIDEEISDILKECENNEVGIFVTIDLHTFWY